jgi:hypothetical protein
MIRVVHPGSGFRIQIWFFYPSRITDPGVKKAPEPRSGSATLLLMQKKRTNVLVLTIILNLYEIYA